MLNLLDHFYHPQYKFKAAGIASYGAAAGGARAAYVLRNTLGELGLVVAPTALGVPNIWAGFTPEGEFTAEAAQGALDKFLTEFGFLAATLRDVREAAKIQLKL
jgi:NAD(P)H-dependent FMN reductase